MPHAADEMVILPPAVGDGLADLLARLGRRYRKRLKGCQTEFSEKAVHDLRVSIRRLLATVELIEVLLPSDRLKKLRRRLKRQLAAFSELRDTQVQLGRLASLSSSDRAARALRRCLRQRERRCIRDARKIVKRLRPGRVSVWIADCERKLRRRRNAPAGPGDLTALLRGANAAFAQVQAARRAVDAADTDTIHRTRVAFKKYRYMAEALASVLPEVDRPSPKAMRAYQNLMGSVQDATVLGRCAGKFARKHLAGETGQRFLAALDRERHLQIRRYLRAADKLNQFGPLRIPAPPSTLLP